MAQRLAIPVLLWLTLVALPSLGQTEASLEEEKARFVYNFISFVDWPDRAFKTASEAFRIAIIGRDPFNGWLDRLIANKSVHDRGIVITRPVTLPTSPLPHVLFVGASQEDQIGSLLTGYCGAPVLTVSDIDRFANRGGVIGLVVEGHAVRFAINRTAAEEARLRVSARLFHLAIPLYSAVSPCGAPASARPSR